MDSHRRAKLLLALLLLLLLLLPVIFLLLLFLILRYFIRIRFRTRNPDSLEAGGPTDDRPDPDEPEALVAFPGGEDLTVQDILEAPGEVVGKSTYGTSYRAGFCRHAGESVMLLRFVRPACVGRTEDLGPSVRALGSVRHPNLVPLSAMYVGPRREKLFVHPFYGAGNLQQFLKDGKAESHRWEIIYKLSLGIARGLDHLHNRLDKPVVHGNLKSKNVLIDDDFQPRLSDFGLHLLLNPTAAQEMLESNAAQGYKPPELIKMKDASRESDIYALGVIFLEILTRKDPTDLHLPASLRNVFQENEINGAISSDPADQNQRRSSTAIEDGLLRFFQLAMACCSPTPVLRPDIVHVLRKIEEIGQ